MRYALLALAFVAVPIEQVHATVLTFDDNAGTVGASYGGFNWTFGDWFTVDDAAYSLSLGNSYGSPSGTIAVHNGGDVLSTVTSGGGDFDFNGAYFTGMAQFDQQASFTSRSVTVEGWDDGLLIGSVTMQLPTASYSWLSAGFASVDTLRFRNDGTGQRWWIMDDFTFNEPLDADPTVPESTSLALMGLGGLGMLGGWYRKRKQALALAA